MTVSHLPRRAVVGVVLSTALVGAGLAAFAADAAPGACPATYTDPAGDSGLGDAATNPLTGDDDLDLVAVTHSVAGEQFTTSFKVVKLLESGPDFAFADRFISAFTVAGKAVEVTAERDFSGAGETKGSAKVGGATVTFPVKVVEDIKGSTISAVLAAADLEKAVGTPLAAKPFSAMSSTARAVYPTNASPGTLQPSWDTATAGATSTYSFGGGCGGATAPAPASPSPATSPPATGGTPPSAGGDPLTNYPAADCATYKDPKGDAIYNNTPNDPDLDITAYTLRTTPDALVAYIKVDKLGDKPTVTPFDGHRFYSDFTFNKHVFTVAASAFSSYGADVRDGASQSGQVGPMAAMTVDSEGTGGDPGFTDAKVTAKFDTKASIVVLSVPIASIEKYGKAPLAGATLTAVAGRAGSDTSVLILPTDGTKSAKPENDVYVIGDNKCFAPPVSPLSSVGVVRAQYGDTAAVAAKLVDASGAPMAGKKVTFTLGRMKAVGTTAGNGIAKAALPVKEKAGKRALTIAGEGAKTSTSFTVVVEKTALKATGSKGTVTARLSDDDRKPVGGQTVRFTSGSKKVTAKTDAKGVAKAAGFPAGSTVKVAYVGAAGTYAGSTTSAKA